MSCIRALKSLLIKSFVGFNELSLTSDGCAMNFRILPFKVSPASQYGVSSQSCVEKEKEKKEKKVEKQT